MKNEKFINNKVVIFVKTGFITIALVLWEQKSKRKRLDLCAICAKEPQIRQLFQKLINLIKKSGWDYLYLKTNVNL